MSNIGGTIENITEKTAKTGKKFYTFTVDSVKMSCFDKPEANNGDQVFVEYVTKGEYNNASSIVKTEPAHTKASEPAATRDDSIIRQNALRHADMLINLMLDQTKTTATQSESYILKKYFALAETVEEWITRPKGMRFSEEYEDEED